MIDDQDITKMKDKELRAMRKKIGMIFQHFNLMRSHRLSEYRISIKGKRIKQGGDGSENSQIAELVDLSDKVDAYPSQLSGGQKAARAIARALANDPKVLLCDEATSVLIRRRPKAFPVVEKGVNEELGITIVLITHEMAARNSDRVAVMETICCGGGKHYRHLLKAAGRGVTRNFIASTSNAIVCRKCSMPVPVTRLEKDSAW